MTDQRQDQPWQDLYYSAQDGLRLHVGHYTAPADDRPRGRPAVCLPGLTRNGRDFHSLAEHLTTTAGTARDVYCLDYRGRGQSDRDPDWSNYTPYVELLDVLDFLTLAGLHDTAIIGTSRGGLITMMMAAARPTAIGVAVLNDIGPVIEPDGLRRIAGYVGKTPPPASWEEAVQVAKSLNQADFPVIGDDEWRDIARQWFADEDGRPVPDYDPGLGRAFADMDPTVAPPPMWPQFTALSAMPALVIRGENSDLLSAGTVEEMRARHPALQALTVSGQGHAPLLRDRPTNDRIATFLSETDARRH